MTDIRTFIMSVATNHLAKFSFPLAALIAASQGGSPWLSAVFLVAGCALIWVRTPIAKWDGYKVLRALILASALTVAAADGTLSWQLALVAVSTLVSIMQEPVYEKLLARPELMRVMNLASVPADRTQNGFNAVVAGHAVLLLTTIGVAASGVSGWIPLAVLAVFTVLNLVMCLAAWRRKASGHDPAREAVLTAIRDTTPRFALYFSAPAGTEYQLRMWLPHFEQLGDPFVVIVRERRNLPVVAALTDAPVVFAKTIADIEDVLIGSVRSVFYVNNAMRNTHAIRLHELTHVQLGHGESDKMSSFSPVFRMYDLVFAAGQAAIDRFANNGVAMADSQFQIVGRPQVADILVDSRLGADDRPTVLYAPTWKGHSGDADYCSLGLAPQLFAALFERDVNVILRPHPYTRQNATSRQQLEEAQRLLREDAEVSGRNHVWGAAAETERSLIECFNQADALITDVSSVAADWLYSEKPLAVCDVQGKEAEFAEEFPLAKAAYVVDRKASNAAETVRCLLDTDPRRHTRGEAKRYYLGDFPADGYGQVFAEAAAATYRESADRSAAPLQAASS